MITIPKVDTLKPLGVLLKECRLTMLSLLLKMPPMFLKGKQELIFLLIWREERNYKMSVKTKPYLEQLEDSVEAYSNILDFVKRILHDDKDFCQYMEQKEKEILRLAETAIVDAINFKTPSKS